MNNHSYDIIYKTKKEKHQGLHLPYHENEAKLMEGCFSFALLWWDPQWGNQRLPPPLLIPHILHLYVPLLLLPCFFLQTSCTSFLVVEIQGLGSDCTPPLLIDLVHSLLLLPL